MNGLIPMKLMLENEKTDKVKKISNEEKLALYICLIVFFIILVIFLNYYKLLK